MLKILLCSIGIICLFQIGCNRPKELQKNDISISAKICGEANKICERDSTCRKYTFIDLTLANQSNSIKSIWFYSCSWMDSWTIEPNFLYFYSEGCDANFPKRIDLKPSQSINFNGIIANRKDLRDTTHFRIGFADFNEVELKALIPSPTGFPMNKVNPKIYWSNWLSMHYCNNSYEISK